MLITLNGKPGSGKSTVARALAQKLGYPMLDVGHLRRDAARQRGLHLDAYNVWAEKHPAAGDRAFDRAMVAKARQSKNLLISSRTAFHFLPESFKVFLDVSFREGARRVFQNLGRKRNEGSRLTSKASVERSIRQRVASDTRRYRRLYGFRIFDRRHYDFVFNTSRIPIPTVVRKVESAFRSWQREQG
jgi:CMP/dCMP kinase